MELHVEKTRKIMVKNVTIWNVFEESPTDDHPFDICAIFHIQMK